MIYFILAVYLFFLYLIYNNITKESQRKTLFLAASIPFIALFALRGVNVGGDTLTYVTEFKIRDYADREFGYFLFCELISIFGRTPFVYIFFTAIISVLPFVLLVRYFGNNNPLPLLYVFLFPVVVVCIETNVRQDIGTGFVMLSYYALEKTKQKKWYWKLVPITLLVWGALCHASLYFLVPICVLIYYMKLNKQYAVALIIISFFVGGFGSKIADEVLNYFFVLSEGVEGLVKLNSYQTGWESTQVAFSIARIMLTSWILLIVYCCNNNEISNFFIKCFVVYIVVYNLACGSPLMYRLVYSLHILSFVYVPIKFKRKEFSAALMLFIAVWMWHLFLLCTTPSRQNRDAKMFPYEMIINF